MQECHNIGGRMSRRSVRSVVASFALASALLFGLMPSAHAIEVNAVWPELGLPGFRIIPYFTERGEYRSNVLLLPRNELDDFISKSIPGVVVELPLGRHRFDLAARAEIVRYLNNPQFDSENFFLLARLALNFPGGLRVRLREEFAKTSDPPGTELTGRIDSTTNKVSPEIEYAVTQRLSLGASYAFTNITFGAPIQELSRTEHLMGLTGFWKITASSDLLANVAYGREEYDTATNRDAERFLGMVGVRGELTSRLSSTFRIGYEHREDNAGQTRSGLISSGETVFVPTERTRISLTTQRSFEQSTFGTNNTFTTTVATLAVRQILSPKIVFEGRLFGGMNDYQNLELDVDTFHRRSDWITGLGLGVDYQIQRWLTVGADYTFTDRKSNFSGFDYTSHVIGVKVTLSL
jgi:hypothetical protein